MNRDEILQRSRAEKEDEGNTFLEIGAAGLAWLDFAPCISC